MRHAQWSRDALGQQVASPPRGAHGVDLGALAATGTGWTGWTGWEMDVEDHPQLDGVCGW